MVNVESLIYGEPDLEDMLDGEPCRLLMARDGLRREDVLRDCRAAAGRLSRANGQTIRRLAA